MSHDEITNPKHYDLFPDGMQAIDVIRAALTPEEFAGYCKGNFLKYRLRAGEKGDPVKCLGKAEWYRAELREHHAEQRRQEAEDVTICPPEVVFWPDEDSPRQQRIEQGGELAEIVYPAVDSHKGPCLYCGAFPGYPHAKTCPAESE